MTEAHSSAGTGQQVSFRVDTVMKKTEGQLGAVGRWWTRVMGPKVRGLGQVETPSKPIRTRLEDRIGQQIDPYANLLGRDF